MTRTLRPLIRQKNRRYRYEEEIMNLIE